MNTILVFNVGSSSVKYALYENQECKLQHNFERVVSKEQRSEIIHSISQELAEKGFKPTQIAHRIVHGGTLSHTVEITPPIRAQLEEVSQLAPLHNIPELEVVDFCVSEFGLAQYAVFDTAFHQTIPQKTHMYPIPWEFYEKGIRKYGFHGISHEFISKGLGGKVITCHLGSGCSITAIKDGKSIQTSMGFTPLDGVMMGTRPGAIDPGVLLYLQRNEKLTLTELDDLLNKKSGLFGIGGTNDMRDLEKSDDPKAKLAIEMYHERIISTIGSYIPLLGGLDTIVFTAGTGENGVNVREMICNAFAFLGVKINSETNNKTRGDYAVISAEESSVEVIVIPTNEELAIVQKVDRLIMVKDKV